MIQIQMYEKAPPEGSSNVPPKCEHSSPGGGNSHGRWAGGQSGNESSNLGSRKASESGSYRGGKGAEKKLYSDDEHFSIDMDTDDDSLSSYNQSIVPGVVRWLVDMKLKLKGGQCLLSIGVLVGCK